MAKGALRHRPRQRVTASSVASTAIPRLVQRLLFGLVVATPALVHFVGARNPDWVANADHLLVAEIFSDLGSGGSLSEWYLPYSAYFAPDWLTFGVASLVFPHVTARLAFVALIQFGLVMLSTKDIARRLRPNADLMAVTTAGAVVCLLAIAAVRPAAFSSAMLTHFGTFALFMAALAATSRFVAERSVRWLTASVAISLVAVASDRIFVVWFLVPAAFAIAAWGWRNDFRPAIWWLASHVAGSMLALPLRELVSTRRSTYDLELQPQRLFDGPSHWGSVLSDALWDGPWLLVPAALSAVLAVSTLRRMASTRDISSSSVAHVLAIFLPLTIVCTIGAQLMLSGSVAAGPRYNFPVLVLPILLLGATHVSAGTDATGAIRDRPIKLAALAPLVLLVGWWGAMLPRFDLDREPAHVACIRQQLDESGSRQGIAAYPDARPVAAYLDDIQVGVATHNSFLQRTRVNTSERFFRSRSDFVVVDNRPKSWWTIDTARVEHLYDQPLATVECGQYTILDFGPDGFQPEPFRNVGDRVAWRGCELPGLTGSATDAPCTRTASPADAPGFLSFGPHAPLSSGRYQIVVRYSVGRVEAGTWDVALTYDQAADLEVVASGSFAAESDGEVVVELEVIPRDGIEPLLEFRSIYTGQSTLVIESLTIVRID